MERKKKKISVPHTYVILCMLVLICAIMTWLIPAGAYDRVEDAVTGKMVVDPDSFHFTDDGGGLGFFDVMLEFIKGMESASDVIFFIFIIGGAFTIIQDTGAMSASIHAMVRKFGKKQNLILILFIFMFSVLGGTMGMAEELIVFIPLLVTLCNELKLDRMVALAVSMIGAPSRLYYGTCKSVHSRSGAGNGRLAPLFRSWVQTHMVRRDTCVHLLVYPSICEEN